MEFEPALSVNGFRLGKIEHVDLVTLSHMVMFRRSGFRYNFDTVSN